MLLLTTSFLKIHKTTTEMCPVDMHTIPDLVITVTLIGLPLPALLTACTVILYEVLLFNSVNVNNVLLIIFIVPSSGDIAALYFSETRLHDE